MFAEPTKYLSISSLLERGNYVLHAHNLIQCVYRDQIRMSARINRHARGDICSSYKYFNTSYRCSIADDNQSKEPINL